MAVPKNFQSKHLFKDHREVTLFPFELNLMKTAFYFCDLNTIINANVSDIKTLITQEPQTGSRLRRKREER